MTVPFLQVEDITASHEAALLEMENNHTVAITILQDDHDHKVQGMYQAVCVAGKHGRAEPRLQQSQGPPLSSYCELCVHSCEKK